MSQEAISELPVASVSEWGLLQSLSYEMSLLMFVFMQVKLIFIWKDLVGLTQKATRNGKMTTKHVPWRSNIRDRVITPAGFIWQFKNLTI